MKITIESTTRSNQTNGFRQVVYKVNDQTLNPTTLALTNGVKDSTVEYYLQNRHLSHADQVSLASVHVTIVNPALHRVRKHRAPWQSYFP